MKAIIVGTRGSRLALAQTQQVIHKLNHLSPTVPCHIKTIKTLGDKERRLPLPQIGGKGVFIKELEEALLRREIDLAVHSFKDLPTSLALGLEIAAILERGEARDALVSASHQGLEEIPPCARLGTSSPRRAAQILAYRSDLEVVDLRGNLDTRLRKVEKGMVEAALVAAVGLIRLGWQDRITEYLSPEVCLPAVGQGALAVELRQEDGPLKEMVACLDHAPTRQAITAERAFLEHLGGGCNTPIAAYGQVEDGRLYLQGMVATPQGHHLARAGLSGDDPVELGRRLAERLLSMGAREMLQGVAP